MKKYIIIAGVSLSLLLGTFVAGRITGKSKAYAALKPEMERLYHLDSLCRLAPKADKEYSDSTIVIEVPVPTPVPMPYEVKGDTEYIHIHDTVTRYVSVSLPITTKEYREENYYARISGYEPNLDEIKVFFPDRPMASEGAAPVVKKQYTFIELDAQLAFNGQFISPVTFNVGRKFGAFEVYAGGGYDLTLESKIIQFGGRARFDFNK